MAKARASLVTARQLIAIFCQRRGALDTVGRPTLMSALGHKQTLANHRSTTKWQAMMRGDDLDPLDRIALESAMRAAMREPHMANLLQSKLIGLCSTSQKIGGTSQSLPLTSVNVAR
jgi:hypothetical protein